MRRASLFITIVFGISVLLSLSQAYSADAATLYVSDSFGRSISAGWGSAATGGAYALTGGAADFSVNGTGKITSGAGVNHLAVLNSISVRDVNVSFRFMTNKVTTGSSQSAYALIRRVNSSTQYLGRVSFTSDGKVYLRTLRDAGGTRTELGTQVAVPGLIRSPGQFVRVRIQASGANPTTIRMRAWADGQTEPTTWYYTATDATAGLQTAGALGLQAYVSSAATNAPILFTFDDFVVTGTDIVVITTPTSGAIKTATPATVNTSTRAAPTATKVLS